MGINIDDLTLGEIRQIQALCIGITPTLKTQESAHPLAHLIGQKVIVRGSKSGVNYGTLKYVGGGTVILTNARRLHYWVVKDKAGISLSDVAKHGLNKESRVCAIIEEQSIIDGDAGEIITTTDAAQKSIEAQDVYRP